jgi:Tol biopolymer transport system component
MREHRSSGIGRVQRIAGLGLTLALLGTVLPNAKAASAPGTIDRVSVSATGAQRNNLPTGSSTGCSAEATNGKCTKRSVSDNGDLVVFSSKAPNLVSGDTNGVADIFIWRRNAPAGEANVISITPGGNGASEFATISPNGEWVAFESKATNLPGVENTGAPAFTDVYVYNVASKAIHWVNVPNQDGQTPNNKSVSPSVANNGAVAFGSFASNMVLPQGNATFQQVYVNRTPASGGRAELVSVTASGAPGNGPGKEGWISGAGDKIVFTSFAPLDTNEDQVTADDDVYVRELGAAAANAVTKRLTSDAQAGLPSISASGSTVAFMAEKSLASGDGDVRKDIYTVSANGGSPSLASDCACSGNDLMDRPAVVPSVADDGTVTYQSAARFINGVTSEQVWLGSGPTLVSGTGTGETAVMANDVAELASISANGNFVAFSSVADNLVPGDFNGAEDVFLWERTGGTIIRVSTGPGGIEASGFALTPNSAPAMSADGKVVAFESDSSNLVDGDNNGMADIFVRANGTTTRIMGQGGVEPNGSSFKPVISGDGNIVVFESVARNMVTAGDTNEAADIYMFNRASGELKRVTTPPFGEQTGIGATNASISSNGQWIAFESEGYFDDTTPPNQGTTAIYRYNVAEGKSRLVTRSGDRPQVANSRPSFDPSVANDGSVAFVSRARNLVLPEEGTGTPQASADDIFVVRPDLSAVKASVDNGGIGGDGDSYEPAISADGQHVAFASLANNLVAGASGNADRDVFVRHLAAGTTELVSKGMGGVVPNGASFTPAINENGTYVAFASGAENIAPGDNNAVQDVFLANLANGGISKISVRPNIDNHQGNDASYMPALSASGLIVGFKSKASNLIDGDDNAAFDTFVRDLMGVPPVPCTSDCGPGGGPGGPITGLGYRFVAGDGGVFNFDMHNHGSMGATKLNKPIVGMASTPTNNGYWMVATDGGIFSFGDAAFQGSTGDIRLNSPIVGMAAHPSGKGYWFVAADGGIFSFGDAKFHGSMGGKPLNKPIVAMAASSTGNGYWLVASDGGIFSFGDAAFHGSTGAIKLNKPIVGMDRSSGGQGYRFVASDGGIFSFGDASFKGSMGGTPLNKPIVGMAKSRVGDGYWLVASDGGVFSFGDAAFKGSTGAIKLNSPIVGMAS